MLYCRPILDGSLIGSVLTKTLVRLDERTIYLSPAPLYHAAPLGFTMNVQRFGGTVVVMDRFDSVEALRLIALQSHP